MNLLAQLLANGLVNGALFAVVGIGFGFVYRTTRVFHLAYGGIYVLAAYLFYTFAQLLVLPIPLALLLACTIAGLMGCLLEVAVYWPFYRKRASRSATLIASLGVYLVLENLLALIFGNDVKTISSALEPALRLGPVRVTRIQIFELAVGGSIVLGLWILMRSFRVFKAVWAMGDEPELIPVLGLPTRKLRALVLGLSSLLIAVPACLISFDVGISPHVGMNYLLIGSIAVFFGGLDRYAGWVAGGFVLAALQSLTLWQLPAQWMDLGAFSLLVVILFARPQGILGSRKRIEEA